MGKGMVKPKTPAGTDEEDQVARSQDVKNAKAVADMQRMSPEALASRANRRSIKFDTDMDPQNPGHFRLPTKSTDSI